jgi:hypothetical protein
MAIIKRIYNRYRYLVTYGLNQALWNYLIRHNKLKVHIEKQPHTNTIGISIHGLFVQPSYVKFSDAFAETGPYVELKEWERK